MFEYRYIVMFHGEDLNVDNFACWGVVVIPWPLRNTDMLT